MRESDFKYFVAYIWVDLIKNVCGHSGHMTLKFAVSQEGLNGIVREFLHVDTKIAKSYVNNFSLGVVKNGYGR